MKTNALRVVALLVSASLVAPAALFGAPRPVHAAYPVVETGKLLGEGTITAIKTAISSVADVANSKSLGALVIDKFVLEPLAFVVSGNLLKSITGGIVSFVIGKTNGTGAPQFVQNLRGNLQSVSDVQAFSFLSQFEQNSRSPFAGAIASSLRTNYLQQTSLAGYFAANQCTLSQASPDIRSYVAGNWSQGGVAAWFALTTQNNNNPYLQYQAGQNEISALTADATGARLAELNWGQGYLSWCGGSSLSTTVNANGGGSANSLGPGTYGSSAAGAQPGDSCYQADGTPGTIQTPGSLIHDLMSKVAGNDIDKLLGVGNISPEINSILGDIGNVMTSVNFVNDLLGGASGGLASAGSAPSGGTSLLFRYQNSPPLGVSTGGVYQGAAPLPQAGSDTLTLLGQYDAEWNTIGSATDAASTSVSNLSTYCSAQAAAAKTQAQGLGANDPLRTTLDSFVTSALALAQTAQNALATVVGPVAAQVSTARANSATARAAVQKLQAELAAGSGNTADLQTLQNLPPTAADLANASQQAQNFNEATANPAGSLNVSGGTLVDQMTLVSGNAQSLEGSCAIPTAPPGGTGGGGGNH